VQATPRKKALPSIRVAKIRRRPVVVAKVGRRQGTMTQERGNHSVAPRYPWVGKTMEGVTPWESLRALTTRG